MSNLGKMISRLLEKLGGGGKSESDNIQTEAVEGNPWQIDLHRLARERGLEGELLSNDETVNTQLQELKEGVKAASTKDAKEQESQEVDESGKPKRKTSETATDMKAWWGQAVATWDPADGKNVDSVEKKIRGPQGHKWFHH